MSKIVVFVDDSKTVLRTVEIAVQDLVDKGVIELITYTDPLDFLNEIKEGTFDYDLLFTDINMPQMNGLELSKQLKMNPRIKNKPILALTTENSNDIKQVGKEIGITGWVVKPFSEQKIIMAIKRVLRIR